MVLEQIHAGIETVRPGRELFVRQVCIGEGNKPDIQFIFLHGLCATERQFQLLLESLDRKSKRRIKCLLYDMAGNGQSPPAAKTTDYEISQVAEDFAAVAALFRDDKLPTVWICHSYGSTVLLNMLRTNEMIVSEEKTGFVFLSTAVRSEKFPHADGGHPIMKLPVVLLNCLQTTLTNAFVKMAVHPSRKDVQEMVRNGSDENNMAVAKCWHRNMRWATVEYLEGEIKERPALVIHGVDDGIIPLECGQHLANQLPKSKFVALEKSSHLTMMELPERVADEILLFLNHL